MGGCVPKRPAESIRSSGAEIIHCKTFCLYKNELKASYLPSCPMGKKALLIVWSQCLSHS